MSLENTDFKKREIIINPKKYVKLLEENSKLKKEIIFLKSHLGKDETEWIIKRDLAIRTNRIPNEPNEFGFPLDFDEEKVHHLHTSEKNPNWWHFKYYYNNDFPDGKYWEYDMPFPLLKALPSLLKKKGKTVSRDIKPIVLKDKKEIKTILEDSGKYIDDLEYLDTAIDFLWGRKGKKFGTNDFQRRCEIGSSSTVQDYLKMFRRPNIIVFLKKGWYKVNIK